MKKQIENRKKAMILWALLSVFIPLTAQQTVSLEDCIRIGLERNYAIQIVRNEQQISKNNATIGNAGFLPTADFSGGANGTLYDYNNRLMEDGSTEKINGVNNNTANAGLNINWTIFDGFGIQTTYAQLKEQQQLGDLNLKLAIEDLMADISGEYYNYIRQKIRFRNLKATLNLSRERLRIVEERYTIGSMSRLDLQQAQVDFNADSSNVLNQRQTVHNSRIRLNQLMALDDVETLVLVRDSFITPNVDLQENLLWESTQLNNTSLLISQKNILLSELDYKKVKSRNYPTVRLNGGYGYTANWYETGTIDMQQRLGLSYGVTVGFTLFDGLNRKREQRNARIQVENRTLRTQDIQLTLQADMSNLWMSYQNNLTLWNLEKENVVAAQENYNIAIERYKLGDLSGIELREAQNSLLAAEERLSTAEYSTKICEISLLQLSGQIMNNMLAGDL